MRSANQEGTTPPPNMRLALDKYSTAAKELFRIKRNNLALASFEEHFEREVRQKLRLELKVLDTIHSAFNNYMDSLPEGPSTAQIGTSSREFVK